MTDNTNAARSLSLNLLDAAKDFDAADPLSLAFTVLERTGDQPWYAPAVAAMLAAKLAVDGAGEGGAAHLWTQARLGISAGEGLSRVERLAMGAVLDMTAVEPLTAIMLAEDLHERHGLVATYHAIAVGVQLVRYVAELVGDPSILDPAERAREALERLADEITRKQLPDSTIGESLV